MRKSGFQLFLCFGVMATLILSGCEWQGTSSKDTWSESTTSGINFSGYYTPAPGAYLVEQTPMIDATNVVPLTNISPPIYTLTVSQLGNVLTFTDSNGSTYTGDITSMSTPTASASNLLVSTTVVGNFTASGTSANGLGVTIVGAFYGDYTIGSELGSGGALQNMSIQGTWIESNGLTENIYGTAGGTVTISAGTPTNNNNNNPWWYYYY